MRRAWILLVPLAGLFSMSMLAGFTGGPPPGISGAPGEMDCTVCHGSYPLNSGTATFSILAPPVVGPGQTVPILVVFTGSTLAFTGGTLPKFGFEMTAQSGGAFVGSWQITDPINTQMAGTDHVTHSGLGTMYSSWTVGWTAPLALASPTVTFYASGVESNNGNANNFDYVYNTSTSITVPNLSFTVSSTNQDFVVSLSGPGQAGHQYWVLPSADPTPGPWLGLSPDPLTMAVLTSPPSWPGLHAFLDASGNASASYPPGSLSFLTGVSVRLVALTLDPGLAFSGFTDVVTITP